ncbi:SCO2322 family protein [Streptomyces sp. NBC_00237]|uniref:SCO2322 family protein n=1 Tax=Streptomyces sp. NBC_00237 TaxID=2975687 RepID=UPI00224FEA8D|nr:SCO2322 family protein [Streptomyces sp. NBC_00237]
MPALGAFAPAAYADGSTGYRYWSFWERDDANAKWVYATQGAATTHPADGTVQGFRFAVSKDSQDAAKPRGAADFAAACASTPAKEGSKRIALVLDFGTPDDAPEGETPPAPRTVCAQVGEDATTAEALAGVARPLRYNNAALLCAIGGYPKVGCAEQVSGSGAGTKTPAPAATDSVSTDEEHGSGPSAGLIVGAVAVLLLGGAAVWQARRRRG